MTARLVCRDWRQASANFLTHLNLNAWLDSTGADVSSTTLGALARILQSLPTLSSLALRIVSPQTASLLSLPGCSSVLKRLDVNFYAMSSLPSPFNMAVALAPIPHLTSVTHLSALMPGFKAGGFGYDALDYLAVLTPTVVLEQCTRLCKVVLSQCTVEEWMRLLPLLAGLPHLGLPHLGLLGDLPLCDQELVAAVASMTQLTHVLATDDNFEGIHLQLLLRLPALRALHLCILNDSNCPALARAATQGMVQLEHFSMNLYSPENAPGGFEFGSVLAPLSNLTKLEIVGYRLPPMPLCLWQSCLGKLQDLRWSFSDFHGGGVALPLSLRHLELELATWEGPEMPELFQCVAALTRLTALSLSVDHCSYGWTTERRVNATWRAASFLTGLTRLVHLDLDHLLRVENVEGDVECLAVLTGLRSLSLHGSCACHGGEELELGVPEVPPDWSVNECGFEAFEGRGGLLRLLPLASVKVLEVEGPWEVLKGSTFEAEVNAFRSVAGRPPLKFGRLSKRGRLPGTRDNDDL